MPTLTIKGMPDPLYKRLKKRAGLHRRSLNSEILVCLESATAIPAVDPNILLQRVRALRESVKSTPLTDAMIRKAIDRDRPTRTV